MPIIKEEKETLATPNIFGYSTDPVPPSAFHKWQDNNVNTNIIAQGDPNSFNKIGEPIIDNIVMTAHSKPHDVASPVPSNGLNTLANSINGNPDTTNWTSADKAKANEFAIYGNPWNSSMNTPGINLDSIPTQQQRVASPTQNIQTVGSDQVQTQSQSKTSEFRDGYGSMRPVFKTYDAAGNLMTRADIEQAENMYLARELARKAALPDNRLPQQVQIGYTEPTIVKGKHGGLTQIGGGEPIYQMIAPSGPSAGQAAAQALQAFNKITGTIPEYQKDAAGANLANVNSSLLPDKTAAENKQALATANYYNTKAEAESAENAYLLKNADAILGTKRKGSSSFQTPTTQEERRVSLPNVTYFDSYPSQQQSTARQRLNKILGR